MENFIKLYLKMIEKELAAENATEHTHRPAFKLLVESFEKGITATNEARRVECGAPDFVVSRKGLTVGYIETKDVGRPLDEVERSDQLARYRRSLHNLILTDYLEFRWYVDGEVRAKTTLARAGKGGKLLSEAGAAESAGQMLKDFLAHKPEPISTPKELAQRMARLTHIIRDIIIEAFQKGKASDLMLDLRGAFAKTLVPDLDKPEKTPDFADMYAQTLAYGLFAARCNHRGARAFERSGAAAEIPKTNPFLRKLFETITGPDLEDEPYAGFVEDLVQLLANSDTDQILEHFGKRTRQQDPVIHFYETFLATYDPRLREARGVYYTPEPVVSYIVRSVDYLLKTRFGLKDGLADQAVIAAQPGAAVPHKKEVPRVLILDPACGTGTFLYAVVDHIRDQFMKGGNAGMWAGYVRGQLLPRLFGFELLMAPYAVAHFKLGMQLAGQDLTKAHREKWGYDLSGDERLGVFLTNTLEEAEKHVESLIGPLRVITEEANAAAAIKRDLPIMVVLGNPPYSGVSANQGKWITRLLEDYRQVDGKPLGEKKVWLKNDYIKFLRFGQWRIERTGAGVLAFITDHSYLDSPTFRGMRQNLMKTFDEIFILNLHGNAKRREKAPDGSKDENVFDITQGVAIALFVKGAEGKEPVIRYADLWGSREAKYSSLLEADVKQTQWTESKPAGPFFEFVPVKRGRQAEYLKGWKVTDIFPVGSNGVQTSRDQLVVGLDAKSLIARIESFADPRRTDSDVRREFFGSKSVGNYLPGDGREWKLSEARSALQQNPGWRKAVIPYLYRPFDERCVLYLSNMVDWPRAGVMRHMVHRLRLDVMRHMLHDNVALCVGRAGLVSSGTWDLVFCTKQVCDHNIFYRGSSLNFPIYLYPGENMELDLFNHKSGRGANLSEKFVKDLSEKLGVAFLPGGPGDLRESVGPEQVFHYVYAILHSQGYRERYAEFLKTDFPRVPFTEDKALFGRLAHLGAEMVAAHLLDAPVLSRAITRYPIRGDDIVEKGYPKYLAAGEPEPGSGKRIKTDRAYISEAQYFEGIPKDVWEFHVGGYRVCEKWLKDRRGRVLSFDDLTHYQKVIVALNETIRLMGEIDKAIPSWPIK